MPLTGGTVTGDLQVDGQVRAKFGGTAESPAIGFDGVVGMGIYTHKANNWLRFAVAGVQKMNIRSDAVIVADDLQVDKVLKANANFTVPNGSVRLEGTVDGTRDVSSVPNFHVNSNGWTFRSTWKPSRMAFAPSKLTRDSDVLERAETATLPPEPETDDDGNQTNTVEIEAHDTVPLFDVVTALLAEIKDLKARIEALEK